MQSLIFRSKHKLNVHIRKAIRKMLNSHLMFLENIQVTPSERRRQVLQFKKSPQSKVAAGYIYCFLHTDLKKN